MTEPHPKPPPLPQTPVPYQSPGSPAPMVYQSAWPTILRFFAGLVLGSVVSAIVWFVGWKWVDKNPGPPLVLVPGVKLLAGIVCLCFRGWRSFGVGILVSIALGMLIFFGACAMNVDWSKMH